LVHTLLSPHLRRSNVMVMMDKTIERCRKFFGIQHGYQVVVFHGPIKQPN